MNKEQVLSWMDKLVYRYEKSRLGLRAIERQIETRDGSAQFPIQLGACLVFRDEGDYLREWLEFHDKVGFDHFFLYDNNSTDDWRSQVPSHLHREGRVTIVRAPMKNPQFVVYNHCLRHARGRVKWLAFLDADEFLYTTQAAGPLKQVLSEFKAHPAVAVNWQMFGTGGHVMKPDGKVVESYRKCAEAGNRHVKIIVRPESTVRIVNPHQGRYVGGRTAVNELGIAVNGPHSIPPSLTRLRINHYWTKSVEEFFLKKIKRGDPMNGQRSAIDLIENEGRCQDTSDDEALQHSQSTALQMQQRSHLESVGCVAA